MHHHDEEEEDEEEEDDIDDMTMTIMPTTVRTPNILEVIPRPPKKPTATDPSLGPQNAQGA